MPVTDTRPEYLSALSTWRSCRDAAEGARAIKAAGEVYLPRLEDQTDEEYQAYKSRAVYFNATAISAQNIIGLLFEKTPAVGQDQTVASVKQAMARVYEDVDLRGAAVEDWMRNIVEEVVITGRGGSLIDWQSEGSQRAYASFYEAENITNWRERRIHGRSKHELIVLREVVQSPDADGFGTQNETQFRVLRLVESGLEWVYQVETWREVKSQGDRKKSEWTLIETATPTRKGKPLNQIPFVFHGPKNSRQDIDRPPLLAVVELNLDHYRLDADMKHGLHFTALPTAWVSGFDSAGDLRIGSSAAWVAQQSGASAGFLEFSGQGLNAIGKAQDRDERLMSVVGTRLLTEATRVAESGEAIALRQGATNAVLQSFAGALAASLSEVIAWLGWWEGDYATTAMARADGCWVALTIAPNAKGITPDDVPDLIAARDAGALSQESLEELIGGGEFNKAKRSKTGGGLRAASPSATEPDKNSLFAQLNPE